MTARDRALGALYGLAVGDALGMPTQALPRDVVAHLFGGLDGFRAGPAENELSAGLPAGRTTDDTDQAVIVAECLVAGRGRVDPDLLARRLLGWQDRMAAAGLRAAVAVSRLGSYDPGADVARRTRWALDLVRDTDDDDLLDLVDGLVGTGVATQEAVPSAFAIASRAATDPWRAGLLGARLGGDSDTIAAIAAAMVGACTGLAALPATAVEQVRRVNGLDLAPLVDDLL